MCEHFFQQEGIEAAIVIVWIIIGLGFSALFSRVSKINFEPHEVGIMCLLWPLAAPILFIVSSVMYITSLKNKAP